MKFLFPCVIAIASYSYTSAFTPHSSFNVPASTTVGPSSSSSQRPLHASTTPSTDTIHEQPQRTSPKPVTNNLLLLFLTTTTIFTTTFTTPFLPPSHAATDLSKGASVAANTKIATGGASTLQSGRTIAVTRGINLDRSDFSNMDLKGVAFQQSIVRDSSFEGSNLVGSSFFDATVDGSNFKNADMTMANVEMAQFNRSILRNTVMREMYVSGSTLFEGVADIEGSDWSETYLRADQKKYLCNHPTAKGTNSKTGVDTRESLMCKD